MYLKLRSSLANWQVPCLIELAYMLSLAPRYSHMCEKEGLVFWATFLVTLGRVTVTLRAQIKLQNQKANCSHDLQSASDHCIFVCLLLGLWCWWKCMCSTACSPWHPGTIISSSFQVVYVHLLICNAPLASNLFAQSGLSMKISSNVYKNVTVSSALCICMSKATAPQDAHRRLVLQVYLGSNTLEFSGIRR